MCRISLKGFESLQLKRYHKPICVEEVLGMWPAFMRLPALGEVVSSSGFQVGRAATADIEGDGIIDMVHVGAGGKLSDDLRAKAKYVVVGTVSTLRIGAAMEFRFLARRLGSDGRFDPDGELISFFLCGMADSTKHGHFYLDRHDILIVGKLA